MLYGFPFRDGADSCETRVPSSVAMGLKLISNRGTRAILVRAYNRARRPSPAPGVIEVTVAVRGVHAAKALGQQKFDTLSDQLVARVAGTRHPPGSLPITMRPAWSAIGRSRPGPPRSNARNFGPRFHAIGGVRARVDGHGAFLGAERTQAHFDWNSDPVLPGRKRRLPGPSHPRAAFRNRRGDRYVALRVQRQQVVYRSTVSSRFPYRKVLPRWHWRQDASSLIDEQHSVGGRLEQVAIACRELVAARASFGSVDVPAATTGCGPPAFRRAVGLRRRRR